MENSKPAIPTWKLYNRPWYLKLLFGIGNYFKNAGIMVWNVIKSIPFKLWALILAIGNGFQGLWNRFVKGDWRTKMSYLIMGFGNFSRGPKQFLVGFLYLIVEVVYVLLLVLGGGPYLLKFGSLGTVVGDFGYDEAGEYVFMEGDNSLKILIFSVFTIMLTIFFLVMYVQNTKSAYKAQQTVANGKPLSNVKQQLNYALNDGYHTTILALPIFGVLFITVLPLICNILIAFTNFNYVHTAEKLFTWTGFQSFGSAFTGSYGSLLWRTLAWTLIWAFFATFTNFFFGMFLAMMINKKSIKMKVFWRTCFVIVIAVPDFVTLMMMSQFFIWRDSSVYTGAFNHIMLEWFHIKTASPGGINWLGGEVWLARTMVIIINLWRGMPFTMLATMGILMNIPAELYESSRIDGAGPVRRFISITFPYIMFVMGPQLITTFTGNINNFNVIYFLTGGGPDTFVNGVKYGATNLLITWLYNLTMATPTEARYNIGSVIGIFTFIISAVLALIVFNSSKSNTQEDTFQ